MENLKKNPLSLQLNVEDFAPASNDEKKSLVVMRESVNFWKDGMRRLRKNKIAMVSLVVILLIAFMAYVLPSFWPYSYEQQIKGSNNLAPFEYSAAEQKLIDQGENVFPHILGTDRMGRDFAVRVMMGTRVSLSVGLLASVLVLLIGATYGAISAFAGGWIDNIMMRITDILYTIPDILLIILLAMAIKEPLESLATKPGFGWMQKLGPNMVSIFIIFALLYWVGMARIVRSQVLTLKESEYVTAARALGASGGRIIKKHLLTNCMGTLIVTTTLQIPSSIFTESYLSFLGLDADKDVETIGQKILTLAAPYVPLDGINDAGVACGIFMSYQGEGKGTPTDTQTDKPDLTSTTLLRLILDYADSVEDAVALAEQYDLHDSASSCFHYMVADSTGRSAVLEWIGTDADHDTDGAQRQLNVLWNDTDALSDSADWQVVTNFIKTPGYYDGTTAERKGLDRYEHLTAALRETDGIVADKNAAMDLLASVGRRTWNNDDSNSNTVHSVVYDLTDKSVLWVGNEHYGEEAYTFEFQLGR